jgi:hypothetical protein
MRIAITAKARDDQVHGALHRHRRARGGREAEVEQRQLGEPVELDAAPEEPVVARQEGEAEAERLAALDQALRRGVPHLGLGQDHPFDAVLVGDPVELLDGPEARQAGGRGARLAVRQVAGDRQPRLGVGGDAPRDLVGDQRRPDHQPDRGADRVVPEETDRGAHREAAAEDADADADRRPGGQGARGRERQQAVEGENAEGAGRDQRRQLVEGAVADAAVVVVVEALDFEDEDQDRAEEDPPEERRDVGARGRRGGTAEGGDRHQPVARRQQPPQQRPALLHRFGDLRPRSALSGVRRPGARPALRGRRGAARRRARLLTLCHQRPSCCSRGASGSRRFASS